MRAVRTGALGWDVSARPLNRKSAATPQLAQNAGNPAVRRSGSRQSWGNALPLKGRELPGEAARVLRQHLPRSLAPAFVADAAERDTPHDWRPRAGGPKKFAC